MLDAELQANIARLLESHDVELVVAGCGRCGWRSPELPAAEARTAFAEHRCPSLARPQRASRRRSSC